MDTEVNNSGLYYRHKEINNSELYHPVSTEDKTKEYMTDRSLTIQDQVIPHIRG